jgi:hypothetical protein
MSKGNLRELIKDPPRDVVNKTCKGCSLFPSKPGKETVGQNVVAAAQAVTNKIARMEAKFVVREHDVSPRLMTGILAYRIAEGKSEANRFKEIEKKSKPKQQAGYFD